MSITIMSIPCGFKIRKKVDVDTFINECMCKGSEYYLKINEDLALFIRKEKDDSISVAEKRWNLYDPFNPLLEVANTNNSSYKEDLTIHQVVEELYELDLVDRDKIELLSLAIAYRECFED